MTQRADQPGQRRGSRSGAAASKGGGGAAAAAAAEPSSWATFFTLPFLEAMRESRAGRRPSNGYVGDSFYWESSKLTRESSASCSYKTRTIESFIRGRLSSSAADQLMEGVSADVRNAPVILLEDQRSSPPAEPPVAASQKSRGKKKRRGSVSGPTVKLRFLSSDNQTSGGTSSSEIILCADREHPVVGGGPFPLLRFKRKNRVLHWSPSSALYLSDELTAGKPRGFFPCMSAPLFDPEVVGDEGEACGVGDEGEACGVVDEREAYSPGLSMYELLYMAVVASIAAQRIDHEAEGDVADDGVCRVQVYLPLEIYFLQGLGTYLKAIEEVGEDEDGCATKRAQFLAWMAQLREHHMLVASKLKAINVSVLSYGPFQALEALGDELRLEDSLLCLMRGIQRGLPEDVGARDEPLERALLILERLGATREGQLSLACQIWKRYICFELEKLKESFRLESVEGLPLLDLTWVCPPEMAHSKAASSGAFGQLYVSMFAWTVFRDAIVAKKINLFLEIRESPVKDMADRLAHGFCSMVSSTDSLAGVRASAESLPPIDSGLLNELFNMSTILYNKTIEDMKERLLAIKGNLDSHFTAIGKRPLIVRIRAFNIEGIQRVYIEQQQQALDLEREYNDLFGQVLSVEKASLASEPRFAHTILFNLEKKLKKIEGKVGYLTEPPILPDGNHAELSLLATGMGFIFNGNSDSGPRGRGRGGAQSAPTLSRGLFGCCPPDTQTNPGSPGSPGFPVSPPKLIC